MAHVPHIRLTVSGILGARATPVEQFSFSLNFGPQLQGDSLVSLPPEAEMTAAGDAVLAWFVTTGARISPAASVTEIRHAFIGAQGRVARKDDGGYMQVKRAVTTGAAGGVGTVAHPFQVATVVSLQTPRAGAGGRGRVFLPAPGMAVDYQGLIAASDASGLATSVAGLISNLNAAFPSLRAVVASEGSILQSLPPSLNPITSVRVGRVLDTLRTRRRSLAEQYATVAVTDA